MIYIHFNRSFLRILAESHRISRSRVIIQNSVIVGSITPNDCNDKINLSSSNIQYSTIAMPTVSQDPLINGNGSRIGVVYPLFSISNGAPRQSWTNTISNPSRKFRRIVCTRKVFFFLSQIS